MDIKRKGDTADLLTKGLDVVRSGTSIVPADNACPRPRAPADPFSLTLSSERFAFSEAPDDDEEDDAAAVDCINKSGHLFAELKKSPPSLREALEWMGYGSVKAGALASAFLSRAEEKLKEFEAPELTAEEVAAVFCYTHECSDEERASGAESPYRLLNRSLSVDRSNSALKKTRGFLFLLLQSLRKLPRYTPANGVLYRGIRVLVQTEADPAAPRRRPYAAGNAKVWWTFTSTSEDLEATRAFLGEGAGTLFTVSGKAWGYDISMFSDYPDEREILLEPERRVRVTSVAREGRLVAVSGEAEETPLVLEDLIRAKAVKLRERASKCKEAPEELRAENTAEGAVVLSWAEPKGAEAAAVGSVLSYQVSLRKVDGRFFNRSPGETLRTRESRYAVRGLRVGQKYEFRVRGEFSDGWGKWSEKAAFLRATPVPREYSWRACDAEGKARGRYAVDEKNPRVVTVCGGGSGSGSDGYVTVPGAVALPPNTVVSWNIKVLRTRKNNAGDMFIGVAPADIDVGEAKNHKRCGWYFGCYLSALYSGPPQSHKGIGKPWGPRKALKSYPRTGGCVGVVMDTAKGELTFVVNGMDLGVAYRGIPLDKALVPCVILKNEGDSVELEVL